MGQGCSKKDSVASIVAPEAVRWVDPRGSNNKIDKPSEKQVIEPELTIEPFEEFADDLTAQLWPETNQDASPEHYQSTQFRVSPNHHPRNKQKVNYVTNINITPEKLNSSDHSHSISVSSSSSTPASICPSRSRGLSAASEGISPAKSKITPSSTAPHLMLQESPVSGSTPRSRPVTPMPMKSPARSRSGTNVSEPLQNGLFFQNTIRGRSSTESAVHTLAVHERLQGLIHDAEGMLIEDADQEDQDLSEEQIVQTKSDDDRPPEQL